MNTKVYKDLASGERFHSPRKEEGVVTVVCPPGKCSHDRSRDEYGCHVRGEFGEFFVNWMPDGEVTLA